MLRLRRFLPGAIPLFVVALSCSEGATAPITPPDVRQWTTGRAAAALDASGNFVFAKPAIQTPSPVIDETRAKELALTHLKVPGAGPGYWHWVELQRGAPVNPAELSVSPRVEFAESPYEPAPSDFSELAKRLTAPDFLVRVTQKGLPAVVVTVPANSVDLTIQNGTVRYPHGGVTLSEFGMRPDGGYSNPLDPEHAVQFAATATGAKVSEVPVLLKGPYTFSTSLAKWKVVMDRDVNAQRIESGERVTTRILYVGLTYQENGTIPVPNALFVASRVQPSVETLPGSGTETIRVRPGYPVRYDEVVVVRN